MRAVRIALVHRDLHATTRGGIGTLYRALALLFHAAGHEIVLITQHTPDPLTLTGIRTLALPRTDDLGRHRQAVETALADVRPDVVESSSWEAETLHYVRRPSPARAPVVVRGDLSAATMRAFSHLITAERELLYAAEKVLAVSEFAAGDLAAAYGIPQPVVIANGVERDRFLPGPVTLPTGGRWITLAADATAATSRSLASPSTSLPPPWSSPEGERHRLVWVGKTTPMKGWDRLERLAGELVDVAHITVLLGHAPPLSPITLSGVEDTVTIVQDLPAEDLPGFYRAGDFLLSTSRWEGFGLAIAEALACGTPVLLPADLGTAPELLAAGGGHTYRTAADLRAILADVAPAATLPAWFDWDTAAAETLAVYRTLHKETMVT
ncbi:glycosyltransferase [Actinoalloteichus fjordicus]|uniref:Glycosyltransferase n=1 Tax=Actinoalloteichus fjordicus TaxID=1612552 RepID=A0AAC9L8M0_9PSEU|nr:glycosyltransferase [Actinoalloteichus fjordicus]